MPIRITGMNSGLDTESIISELVKAKSEKKDKLVKEQTKLQWKQDAWKELNTKVYNLYSKTLSNMRMQSDYTKKTTKVSSSAATVITGKNAVNGVQELQVEQLAKTGYLTGGKVENNTGNDVTSTTTLGALNINGGEIQLSVDGKTKSISLSADMTVNDLVTQLKNAGVNASFDAKNQRFFISAKETGADGDFSLVATNGDGLNALNTLGLSTKADYDEYFKKGVDGNITSEVDEDKIKSLVDAEISSRVQKYTDKLKALEEVNKKLETDADNEELKKEKAELEAYINAEKDNFSFDGTNYTATDNLKNEVKEKIKNVLNDISRTTDFSATRIKGQNAIISLNGAEFESKGNTFEINGLTITANAETAENEIITLTTADDTEGIYDMVKNFFKEYNELINEMDKLYNADSSKGYEPLTDEEKEEMSEKDIEKWEEKIKDSLLRRDSTLNKVASAMKQVISQGVVVDGKQLYLSDFGISTLGYFDSKENEKSAYHIDGDPDDASTMTKADKLKTAIANDPDTVVEFFTNLSKNLYTKLGDMMKKTDYSSSFTLYDDIAMKEEYNDYKDKISKQEEKITDFEDRYYKKFSAMETALAKMQAKESAISGLLGM